MKKGTQVVVRMTRGGNRSGKVQGKESNRGEWLVIKDANGAVFKARPSQVAAA